MSITIYTSIKIISRDEKGCRDGKLVYKNEINKARGGGGGVDEVSRK